MLVQLALAGLSVEHDEGLEPVDMVVRRHRKHDGARYGRMIDEDAFNLSELDPVSVQLHLSVFAPEQHHGAVASQAREVSRPVAASDARRIDESLACAIRI